MRKTLPALLIILMCRAAITMAFDTWQISKPISKETKESDTLLNKVDNSMRLPAFFNFNGGIIISDSQKSTLKNTNNRAILDIPANDDCENAQPLNIGDSLDFDATDATWDGLGGYIETANIWYSYTPTVSGAVQITVYDTVSGGAEMLSIYDGLSCDGYIPSPTPVELQCGQTIATAVSISNSLPVAYTGTLLNYPDSYLPSCAFDWHAGDGIYSYSANFTGTINLFLCPADTVSWPPLLTIMDASGNELACSKNYDWPKTWILNFPVVNGQTYYIAMSSCYPRYVSSGYTLVVSSPSFTILDATNMLGYPAGRYNFYAVAGHQYLIELGCFSWGGGITYNPGSGSITLRVQPPPPANDDCENATIIGDGILHNNVPMQFTGNNIGATDDCGLYADVQKVWVTFTIEKTTDVNVNFCGTQNRVPSFFAGTLNISESCPCDMDTRIPGGLDPVQPFIYNCPNSSPNFYWGGLTPGTYYYPLWASYPMEGDYVINVKGLDVQQCGDNSLYGNAPSTSDLLFNFYMSDTLSRFAMADNFTGINDTINRVTWWGVTANDELVDCYSSTMKFDLIFCNSDFGVPGDTAAIFDVTVRPESTGRMFYEHAQIKFAANLDVPLVMNHGWLIIRGKGADNCAFLWQDTRQSEGSKKFNKTTNQWSDVSQGLAFCMEKVPGSGIDEETPALPVVSELLSNYPNPFNSATAIQFSLIRQDHVSLSIYDIGGRLIRSLYDGLLNSGAHSLIWDGKNESGVTVSSGLYFYNLKCSDGAHCRNMVLIK